MQNSSHSLNGSSPQKPTLLASSAGSDAASPSSTHPMPHLKRGRKSLRPATAPAKEDIILLPTLQASSKKSAFGPGYANMQTLAEDETSSDHSNSRPGSVPSTPFESSTTASNNNSSSSSTTSIMYEPPREGSAQLEGSNNRNHNDSYDWAVFISAYASGRWDPHRTPNPPSSQSPSRMLGEASLEMAIAVNAGKSRGLVDDDDELERSSTPAENTPTSENVSPISKRSRQPSDASNPYSKLPATHRLRNSFSSTSSGSSRKFHAASMPLGPSLSTGASAEQTEYTPQKAKAGLFLNLPSLLSNSGSVTPGVDTPSTPYNVAMQSNALHYNSNYSDTGHTRQVIPDLEMSRSKLSSRPVQPHWISEPAPTNDSDQLPNAHPPPSLKNSISSRAPIVPGYPSPVPASATASRFTHYHLPIQSQLSHTSTTPHASSSRAHDFPNAPYMNAATVRLAGTHVNIAPLALPSPEHELTDPMRAAGALGRHVMVTVPGTLPEPDTDSASDFDEASGSLSDSVLLDGDTDLSRLYANTSSGADLKKQNGGEWREGGKGFESLESMSNVVTTPGGTTRRIRISQELKKFWQGTRDVDRPWGSYRPDDDTPSIIYASPTPTGIGKMVRAQPNGTAEGEEDYFTRRRETSAASTSSPQVVVPTGELDASSYPNDSVDPAADAADAAQSLTISEQFTAFPQPAKMTFSSSSSQSRRPGGSNTAPTSIPIPTPLLSAYSFPYPYDRAHVVMHPHPGGAMSVPVPSTTNIISSSSSSSQAETISSSSPVIPESHTADGPPSRRMSLMRQISAPLPVGSGSIAALGGKMRVGMPMPPQVLPSMREADKNEVLWPLPLGAAAAAEDSFSSSASMVEANREHSAPPVEKAKANANSGTVSNSASMEAMGALINAGQSPSMRAAKEEQMFRELGYLAAPNPPDEIERRRALYKLVLLTSEFDNSTHLDCYIIGLTSGIQAPT